MVKSEQSLRVVMVGAGNVATHLSIALQEIGVDVIQVYSHTQASAGLLAKKLNTNYTTKIDEISENADLYFFSVKDSILSDVIHLMPHRNGIWAHTAGSIDIDIFNGHIDQYGVFYPLQTFSKEHSIQFHDIPLFIEGSELIVQQTLFGLASKLSNNVQYANGEQRSQLHLAAVFACNFTNHLYAIADNLLQEKGLDFSTLRPLVTETLKKTEQLSPIKGQTGPAVRNDQMVMQTHIDKLKEPRLKQLYQLLSSQIQHYHQNDKPV